MPHFPVPATPARATRPLATRPLARVFARLAARFALALASLTASLIIALPAGTGEALAAPAPAHHAPAQHAQGGNWLATVTVTPDGSHIIGNPKAALKLTEYMSYTCPHCAHFAAEASVPLEMGMIAQGKGSFEIRHLLRDPIDMTVAMLTTCVPPTHFLNLHNQFLTTQTKWMTVAMGMTEAQRQRWGQGGVPQRLRTIAGDLHFYEVMEQQGFSRAQTDRCLSDTVRLEKLSAQTANATKAGVEGTPSFAINGVLLAGTHDWTMLQPQINARL